MAGHQRFFSVTDRIRGKYTVSDSGCWIWNRAKSPAGYGIVRIDGRNWLVSRAAWSEANGPIPAGMYVLHRCDTPACVNVEHLFIGTQTDNMRDAANKGRVSYAASHAARRCKVSLEDAELIRLAYETLPVSQSDIAAAWGITQTYVGHIVRCKARAA